jgi:competence protein ComFC
MAAIAQSGRAFDDRIGRADQGPPLQRRAGVLRRLIGEAGDAVVSVFFPGGCRLCERLLTRASRLPICEECLGSFPALPARVCAICGSPALAVSTLPENGVAPLTCMDCEERTYSFERARSYAAYRGVLMRAVVLLKFERIDPLAAYFGERVASVAKRDSLAADIVVPVPLHRVRERERGFNQAELIAREVAKRLRLPLKPVLLTRTKARPDKHILSFDERWRIVRGAFATRPGSQVDNKRVLLLDDVMTTGATLDACAKALLEAGAKSVIGLTVARAVRRETPTGNGEHLYP